MPESIKIKPARAGLIVRDPDRQGRPLDELGEQKPDNQYWRRRLRDGDVVLVGELPVAATISEVKE